ncbi:MAG TPA: hypothetical protein VJJ82_00805 [Candidatus Nanoarchaeia archaeon]|nr:hypothetical protein [Candidatus Nanoarchaeia archaeon]
MTYSALLKNIQNQNPLTHLVVVSISVADELKYYQKQTPKQIADAASIRSNDMSQGSTYIIDLLNDVSYRFKDHDLLHATSRFIGFRPINSPTGIFTDLTWKQFIANLKKLCVLEEDGELHQGTPIVMAFPIPSPVANLAIAQKNIQPVRLWATIFLESKKFPKPKEHYVLPAIFSP